MPRYAMTANFSTDERRDINETKQVLGIKTDYALLREAVLRLCKECKGIERRKEDKRETSGKNGQVRSESEDID